MADKRIDQLTAATSLGDSDLLVVEQSSEAKKATGTVVSNYINSKFGLSGIASDISTLQTAVAGKQDALTIPLPIAQGGTNATTVGNARANLGLGTAATANIDTTLTIVGDAADAKAAGDAIGELRGDFESAVTITDISGNNLLNPDNIQVGQLYRVQTAAQSSDGRAHVYLGANSAYACAYVDIESGKSYICTGVSFNAFTGDADMFATGRAATASASTPNVVFNTTAREKNYNNTDKEITRVYFSWRFATYPVASYMVNEGTTLLPYEEYVEPHEEIALTPDVAVSGSQVEGELGHVYTVDINGGGDYTSWTDCIRALKDDDSRKTIYIKAGTYDIFSEIGGQTYAESISGQGLEWFDVSDVIPPHTRVIGLGEVVFEFKPTTAQMPSDVAPLLSPINVIYDIEMENITIDCDNCRYGIHDETGHIDTVIETRHIYHNVKIRHAYTDRGMKPAFGSGFNRGQYFEFDGCDFQSADRAWSFHNKGTADDVPDGTIIVFKNCISVVDSGQRALRFGNVNGRQVRVDVRVFNTYIGGQVRIQDESITARPNAYALTICGCGNPTIQIDSETNIYEPVVYQI